MKGISVKAEDNKGIKLFQFKRHEMIKLDKERKKVTKPFVETLRMRKGYGI